ncbi:hypothetical protein SB781_08645 [Paraburkholderia sp. SIMBA_061]|jgi:hypothetical protein
MDDRFDRRELLLHLGDVLEALNYVARMGRPDAMVVQLAQGENSLQDLEFLRALPSRMTVAEFTKRVTSAFCVWPRELLEVELNRDALASTVQLNLFDGDPHGWKAYVSHVQNKVKWFGTGLSNIKEGARAEPSHDATDDASPVEAPDRDVSPVEADVRSEKRGWPWPEPRRKS